MISGLHSAKSILLLILLSAASSQLQASEYDFSFTSQTDAGYGVLVADNTGLASGGWVDITAGADLGVFANLEQGISPNDVNGYIFGGDNLIFPGQSPLLDNWGLLFVYTPDNVNFLELNLYLSANWTDPNTPPFYSFISQSTDQSQPNVQTDNVTFNLTAVPEPASLALMGLGLSLLGLRGRRQV